MLKNKCSRRKWVFLWCELPYSSTAFSKLKLAYIVCIPYTHTNDTYIFHCYGAVTELKFFNYCPKLIIQQCYKRINEQHTASRHNGKESMQHIFAVVICTAHRWTERISNCFPPAIWDLFFVCFTFRIVARCVRVCLVLFCILLCKFHVLCECDDPREWKWWSLKRYILYAIDV